VVVDAVEVVVADVVVVVDVAPFDPSDALGLVAGVVVPGDVGPPTVMATRWLKEDVLLRATRANATVRSFRPGLVPMKT
jgi:hypothetical protein